MLLISGWLGGVELQNDVNKAEIERNRSKLFESLRRLSLKTRQSFSLRKGGTLPE